MRSTYFKIGQTCLFASCLLMVGCLTVNPKERVANTLKAGSSPFIQKRNQVLVKGMISTKQVNGGDPMKEFNYMDEYALLSANIYEEGKGECEECEDPNRVYPISHLGWVRRPELEAVPEKPSWSLKVGSVTYQVWEKEVPDEPTIIALVFRGTDWYQLQDWYANLRWFTRLIPRTWDQYDQTRALLASDFIQKIEDHCGSSDFKIIAVGHSLGGGLAQQAVYASKSIKEAYTFDASSVTGYSSVNRKARNENKEGARIYRIYEDGEILALLRGVVKKVVPNSHADPSIIELRYNLLWGGRIQNHDMKKLGCRLHKLTLEQQKPPTTE